MWDDDVSEQVLEEFQSSQEGPFADFDDGLHIVQVKLRPLRLRKTWTDRNAYKAMKQREYKERERRAPPSPQAREVLALRAEVRRRGKIKMRQKLAKERSGVTHHFTVFSRTNMYDESAPVQEIDGYVTANLDGEGCLREIFIRIGKMGDFASMLDQWAMAVSICLQRGEPVKDLFARFAYAQFEPAGLTKNPTLSRCSSLVDYVARWVLLNYSHVPNWEAPATAVD